MVPGILKARLVYSGSSPELYTREYNLDRDETFIGRAGHVLTPSEWLDYIGEGHGEKGKQKEISTSRMHARILREDGQFRIEDLGSLIGTYINGEKLGKEQAEPWKVRYCHSGDPKEYHNVRKPNIRNRNKGNTILNDRDVITLGQEMFGDSHQFTFRWG